MEGLSELEKTVQNSSQTGFKVTGISMQYLHICKRELWFYMHGIDIDRENSEIVRGTSIDENSYKDKSETLMYDRMIAPDHTDNGKIVEVKPSSILEKASKRQLLYYLWYLDYFHDIQKEGILAIPEEKERFEVKLTEEKKESIKEDIEKIYEIYNKNDPPELDKKPYCDSCAYQDFCWSGGDFNEE